MKWHKSYRFNRTGKPIYLFQFKSTAEENVDFGVNIFYFFLHKTAQLSRFFAGFTYCTEFIYSWKYEFL